MNRAKLLASTAAAFLMGAVIVNTLPAVADMPVIDPTEIQDIINQSSILSAIQSIMTTISDTENEIKTFANDIFGAVGDNTFGSVQQLLQEIPLPGRLDPQHAEPVLRIMEGYLSNRAGQDLCRRRACCAD